MCSGGACGCKTQSEIETKYNELLKKYKVTRRNNKIMLGALVFASVVQFVVVVIK